VTGSVDDELRSVVLDKAASEATRFIAVRKLGELGTRGDAEALIELGERSGESEALLRAAGAGLARLQTDGVNVSEWDLRDLALPVADGFFE
jgi:hypothetical protein